MFDSDKHTWINICVAIDDRSQEGCVFDFRESPRLSPVLLTLELHMASWQQGDSSLLRLDVRAGTLPNMRFRFTPTGLRLRVNGFGLKL